MTAPRAEDRPRFVVHLTIRAAGPAAARRLARAFARSLDFVPELVTGETTVSVEGAPDVHHQVFCDHRVDAGRRCRLAPHHDGGCS